jgi:hypothetical protein
MRMVRWHETKSILDPQSPYFIFLIFLSYLAREIRTVPLHTSQYPIIVRFNRNIVHLRVSSRRLNRQFGDQSAEELH